MYADARILEGFRGPEDAREFLRSAAAGVVGYTVEGFIITRAELRKALARVEFGGWPVIEGYDIYGRPKCGAKRDQIFHKTGG